LAIARSASGVNKNGMAVIMAFAWPIGRNGKLPSCVYARSCCLRCSKTGANRQAGNCDGGSDSSSNEMSSGIGAQRHITEEFNIWSKRGNGSFGQFLKSSNELLWENAQFNFWLFLTEKGLPIVNGKFYLSSDRPRNRFSREKQGFIMLVPNLESSAELTANAAQL
jgi:hypothetical protein